MQPQSADAQIVAIQRFVGPSDAGNSCNDHNMDPPLDWPHTVEEARLLVDRADDDPASVRSDVEALLAEVKGDELSEVHAICAWALGLALRHLRSLSAAQEWLERSLRFLPEGGDDHTSAALSLTGVMAFTGELREAEKMLEELNPSEQLRGRVEFQRAALAERLGETDRAAIGYDAALGLFCATGDALGEAHALNGLGLIALERNAAKDAVRYFGLARSLYVNLQLEMLAAVARNNLGLAVMRSGDLITAIDLFEAAADELSAMGEPFAETVLDQVEALLMLGRPSEASMRAQAALAVLQTKGASADRAELLLALGVALRSNNEEATADRAFDVAEQIFRAQERPGWVAVAKLRRQEALGTGADLAEVLRLGSELRSLGMDNAAANTDVLALDLAWRAPNSANQGCLDRLLQLESDDLRKAYAETVSALNDSKYELACHLSRKAIATSADSLASTTSLDVRLAVAAQRDKITSVGLRAARLANSPDFVVDVLETTQRVALRPSGVSTFGAGVTPEVLEAIQHLDQVEFWRQLPTDLGGEAPDTGQLEPRESASSVLAPYELLAMFDDGLTITCTRTASGQSTYIESPPRQQLVDALSRHSALLSEKLKRQEDLDEGLIDRSATEIQALLPWLEGDEDLLLAPTGVLFDAPWTSVTTRPLRIIADLEVGRHPDAHTSLVVGPDLESSDEEVSRLLDLLGDRSPVLTQPDEVLAMTAGGTLHLCCHGHHDSLNPLLSSYELSGGPLSGLDISKAENVPTLVVAAACRSGEASVVGRSSTVGLPTAWLAAGTSVVIAPTCPIPDDRRTVDTMVELHRALADGASPERAVQHARSRANSTVARSLLIVGRLPAVQSSVPTTASKVY